MAPRLATCPASWQPFTVAIGNVAMLLSNSCRVLCQSVSREGWVTWTLSSLSINVLFLCPIRIYRRWIPLNNGCPCPFYVYAQQPHCCYGDMLCWRNIQVLPADCESLRTAFHIAGSFLRAAMLKLQYRIEEDHSAIWWRLDIFSHLLK